MVISGHRGGQGANQPQNTMHAFEAAYKKQLSCIEFDVWLTKDDQLVIHHGDDNGGMHATVDNDGTEAKKFIFDMTLAELQEHYKRTTDYLNAPSKRDEKSLLPTLDELFDFANT